MSPRNPPARRVLQSQLAGAWFTADPVRLRLELEEVLSAPPKTLPPGPVSALILPHAGYAYCAPVAAGGLQLLRGRSFRRVLVLGPSHRAYLPDRAVLPKATHFQTIFGEIPLDTGALDALRLVPGFGSDPKLDSGEHSVEILFPLLQMVLKEFLLVPVVIGQLSDAAVQALAQGLRPLLNPDTLVVVSSDFTHYGPRFDYLPFTGPDVPRQIEELDRGAFEFIRRKDLAGFRNSVRQTGATICGRDAISVLLAMLGGEQQIHLLRYDTSGHRTGDWENTVSYLSAAVTGPWPAVAAPEPSAALCLSEADRRTLLQRVRQTIEARLFSSRAGAPAAPLSPALLQPAGVFVTLQRRGRLRGCIGEIEARRPLVEAAVAHAIHAAFEDPRFPPVSPREWPEVEIEVSVLSPPRSVASWKEIEIGRHGVLLFKQGRSAVFLPQVAPEQGWDLPETLRQLSRKAGLPSDAWEQGADFEVFEALLLHEAPDETGG